MGFDRGDSDSLHGDLSRRRTCRGPYQLQSVSRLTFSTRAISRLLRRHIAVPLHGCSTGTAQTPPPCAGSRPDATGPPEPGTSSPHALQLLRCTPAVAHSPEAVRPAPCAAIPNSCCDQNAAPTPPGHSRSAAITQPATNPLPEPWPARRRASNDPEAGPPLH